MDFRDFIVLNYLSNFQDTYSLRELASLIGLTLFQVDSKLEKLIENGELLLDDQKLVKLTEKGRKSLRESGLSEVNILDIRDDVTFNEQLFANVTIGVEDIYVPHDFSEKFKGYKNKLT